MASSLAFGFLPGGGFAVNTPRNFDRSIPHSFIMLPTGRMPAVYRRETTHSSPSSAAAKKTSAASEATPATLETIPAAPETVLPAPTSVSNKAGEKKHKKNRRQRRKAISPHAPEIIGDEPVFNTVTNSFVTRITRVTTSTRQKIKVADPNVPNVFNKRQTRSPINPKSPGFFRRNMLKKAAKGGAQAAKTAGRRMTTIRNKSRKRSTRRLTAQEKREGWKLPSEKHSAAMRKQPSPSQDEYLGNNMFAILANLSCSQKREIDRTGTL